MAKPFPEGSPHLEMLEYLATRVRYVRMDDGISRRQLAELSGVSERFIADIEAGEANPSLASLAAIADALELKVPEMLRDSWRPIPRLEKLLQNLLDSDQERLADMLEARETRRRPDAGQRVALVGLRGAGKTTLGRLLAKRLSSVFIELDRRIEERAGLPLAQVFEIHGEPYYRRLEYEVLKEALAEPGSKVIETGGGLVSHAETWALLRAGARTIWLKTRPEEYLARVLKQGDRRPMERRPQALAELKALLAAREPAYAQSGFTLDTTDLAPAAAVERVVAWLAEEASR